MRPVVVNQREGCQKLSSLPLLHNIHEQYFKLHEQQVKLHEHHYLIYVQMIEISDSQNSMQSIYPVLVHKPIHYDIPKICDVEMFVVRLTH